MKYLAFLACGWVLGCASIAHQPPKKEYAAAWPNKEWTIILSDALDKYGQELLKAEPRDAKYFCKNFDSVDRKQFYISLISALAKFESNFKPETAYKESFKDSTGQYVVSRGLLQISQESARGYGCEVNQPSDLHNSQINLQCGVRILARWVVRDSVLRSQSAPWKGAARYWSPFRKSYRVEAIADIVQKNDPQCNQ